MPFGMCLLYSNLKLNIADITEGHINKVLRKDFKQHEAGSCSSPEIPPTEPSRLPDCSYSACVPDAVYGGHGITYTNSFPKYTERHFL